MDIVIAGHHPRYPRSQRTIGVYATPGDGGMYCEGWAVRSADKIDLWIVSEVARLPTRTWPAAAMIANKQARFVCLAPVEVVGSKRDGTDYHDPVHYGLALALKSMTRLGMWVGANRSELARRSIVALLIESGRVKFEGQAEQLATIIDMTADPSADAMLTMYALETMTASALTASYTPVADEWQQAMIGDKLNPDEHSSR